MRKLILKMHLSVDGYVGGVDGDVEWIFKSQDETATAWTVDTLWRAGVHIMGGVTYRDMAAYWPSSTEPYAPAMNEIPKIVFSKSLERAEWADSRVVSGGLVEEINRLKRESGKDILAHGGARFAQSLVRHDLVDEYRLMTHPAALGEGLKLFPGDLPEPRRLRLITTAVFNAGVVAHGYQPERD